MSTPGEITTAMALSQPGDTLFMKSGTWKDVKIQIKGYGTEEQHIVIKAQVPDLIKKT